VLPPTARTGIVLAGDLYSVPGATKRGGFGDVSDVWVAFAERFAWVAGVAGNHDDMTNTLRLGARIHVLDGETIVLDGLRIGGVGGIIGNTKKPGRRDEDEQHDRILAVVEQRCDIVVLHEGPNGDEDQRGNEAIRLVIETGEVPLTVCGHAHWYESLARHAHGQILNVDARVVVLVAS
jgi:Icc-related predicted phosphoesterase